MSFSALPELDPERPSSALLRPESAAALPPPAAPAVASADRHQLRGRLKRARSEYARSHRLVCKRLGLFFDAGSVLPAGSPPTSSSGKRTQLSTAAECTFTAIKRARRTPFASTIPCTFPVIPTEEVSDSLAPSRAERRRQVICAQTMRGLVGATNPAVPFRKGSPAAREWVGTVGRLKLSPDLADTLHSWNARARRSIAVITTPESHASDQGSRSGRGTPEGHIRRGTLDAPMSPGGSTWMQAAGPRTRSASTARAASVREALLALARAGPETSCANLSCLDLQPEDVALLSSVLSDRSAPTPVLDLRGNPALGEPPAAARVVALLEANTGITSVFMDPLNEHWAAEVGRRLEHNRALQEQLLERRKARSARAAAARRRQAECELVLRVLEAEVDARGSLAARQQTGYDRINWHYQRGRAALLRKAARDARLRERAARIAALSQHELEHRVGLQLRWVDHWLPAVERLEGRLRALQQAMGVSQGLELIVLAAQRKADARRLERERLERELAAREGFAALEAEVRVELERAYHRAMAELVQQEERDYHGALARSRMRLELEGEERYARNLVFEEEKGQRAWIGKLWDVFEAKQRAELERQRQEIVRAERQERDLHVMEEEIVRPIIQALITNRMGVVMARVVAHQAASNRASHMAVTPMLALRVPDEKPHRYLLRQHLGVGPPEAGNAVDLADVPGGPVDPTVLLLAGLTFDWVDEMRSIDQQEKQEFQRRKELHEKEVALRQHAQEELGKVQPDSSDAVDKLFDQAFEGEDVQEELAPPPEFPDPEVLRALKERILGGTVTFTLAAASDGYPPHALKKEFLTTTMKHLLEPPAGSQPSWAVRTTEFPGETVETSPDSAELVMYIPTRGATFDTVLEMVRSIQYHSILESVGAPAARSVLVQLRVLFPDPAGDTPADGELEPFLQPGADEYVMPRRVVYVEASGVLSVVVCMPWIWMPNESRMYTFTEGDPVEKTFLLPDAQCSDPPLMTRMHGQLTVTSGTIGGGGMFGAVQMSNFDQGEITIEFAFGYTKDDIIVFKSGNEAFYTEADKLIRFREAPILKVAEGTLCKPGAGRPPAGACQRIVLTMISQLANAESIRRVLQRLRFYNVSQDPIEGKRLIVVTMTDVRGLSAVLQVTVNVMATDNPTVLEMPNSKYYFHFPCVPSQIPAHLRMHIPHQQFCPMYEALLEDVDTDRFCGGHFRATIGAQFQRGDTLTFAEECFPDDDEDADNPSYVPTHLSPDRVGLKPHSCREPFIGIDMPEQYSVDHPPPLWDVYFEGRRIGLVGFYDPDAAKSTVSKKERSEKSGAHLGRPPAAHASPRGSDVQADTECQTPVPPSAEPRQSFETTTDGDERTPPQDPLHAGAARRRGRGNSTNTPVFENPFGAHATSFAAPLPASVAHTPMEPPLSRVGRSESVASNRSTRSAAGRRLSRAASVAQALSRVQSRRSSRGGATRESLRRDSRPRQTPSQAALRGHSPTSSPAPLNIEVGHAAGGKRRSAWQRLGARVLSTMSGGSGEGSQPLAKRGGGLGMGAIGGLQAVAREALAVKQHVEEQRSHALFRIPPVDARAAKEVFMCFALTGEASVRSAQAVLRSLVFTPIAKAGDYQRCIDFEILVGQTAMKIDTEGNRKMLTPELVDPSGFQPPLQSSVQVRVTPPLVSVAAKTSVLRYVEGSGAVRIAPFEVGSDTHTDGYEGGFVRLELVDGYCSDDLLAVRDTESISFVLRDLIDAPVPLHELVQHGERYEAGKKQQQGPTAGRGRQEDEGGAEVSAAAPQASGMLGVTAKTSHAQSFRGAPGLQRRKTLGKVAKAAEKADEGSPAISPEPASLLSTYGENKATNRDWIAGQMKGKNPGLDERNVGSSVSEVFFDGHFLGVLAQSDTALQITFVKPQKAEKEHQIGKKEITQVLKSLAYANISKNPQDLNKVVRLTLSDGSPLSCIALAEVNVQPIDDPTEILLKNDRLRYRPCPDDEILPVCIAPLNEARVEDPDTEFFDGGYIWAEIVGGAVKGDMLSVLSLAQQKEQIARVYASYQKRPRPPTVTVARVREMQEAAGEDAQTPKLPDTPGSPGGDAVHGAVAHLQGASQASRRQVGMITPWSVPNPEQYLFDLQEGQRPAERRAVALDGSYTCTITYPSSKTCKDAQDVKISFPKRSPGGPCVISRDVVSYFLNCIAFTCPGAKGERGFKEALRTVQVRVNDSMNPQEGRQRLTIDVRLPFLSMPPTPPIKVAAGKPQALAPKLQVNYSEQFGHVQVGFAQVEILRGPTGEQVEDTLVLNLKEGGFQLKDSCIYQKSAQVCVLASNHSRLLRFEFTAATKGATQKNLGAVLRCIGIKVAARPELSSQLSPATSMPPSPTSAAGSPVGSPAGSPVFSSSGGGLTPQFPSASGTAPPTLTVRFTGTCDGIVARVSVVDVGVQLQTP
eukprot:TRINITY_DN8757_c0_g2_i1.p1 TRINITY_DN8757_c0_g2~~TRINITY_DN8757_c0_g2_i1.p1  ORF type:complete len:2424 (+),score=561.69 TRINITY_DN8757_c0_g2_i1:104-7375(+)